MASFLTLEVPAQSPFSLSDTLKSGQLFHWERLTLEGVDGVAGCIGDDPPSWVAQPSPGLILTLPGHGERVRRYFGIDQSLPDIHATFPQDDPVLRQAMAYCPGIRVARQPVWECLATFITSSLKQVGHIRDISLVLRRRYGTAHGLGGQVFHTYPSPEVVASLGEEALRTCSLGYRAASLARAAEAVAQGRTDLRAIEEENDVARARGELMQLHGVGEKIANCALLFSCGRWGAFPIDVWIERILRTGYRKRIKGARLQAWAVRYFGENAGYAQQYLFHFARKTL